MTLTDPNTFNANKSPALMARAVDLVKSYGSGEAEVRALNGINVEFARGQLTAVMGPSGSGKSTLMHCMAGLDVRDRVGFIFQSFNLVPTLSAAENITLPVDLTGQKVDQVWFDFLVDQLGIKDRLTHRPAELSGGQQQRAACARALISRPDLIFADEPTGNLDSNASAELLTFLRRSVTEFHQSIVMVTHDPRAAAFADRVVFLADGTLVGELHEPTADAVLEQMKQLGA